MSWYMAILFSTVFIILEAIEYVFVKISNIFRRSNA